MRQMLFGIFMAFVSLSHAEAPIGKWTTIDERTGEKRADVELTLNHGELNGKIVQPYEKPNSIKFCSACAGESKNKPIQGLKFIWGLKEDAQGAWVGGRILDPETGRIYHLKIVQEGNTLRVRGYIGHPMLGRTQVWIRA